MGARLQQVLPWQFFLAFALVFGLTLCVIVPPYGAPDEPQQMQRIWSLAHGHMLGHKISETEVGQFVPVSLAGRKDFRVRPASLGALFGPVPEKRVFVHNPQYSIYAPAPYLAQITGVWLGKVIGMNVLGCYYLARLMALLVFTGIVTCAIAQLNRQWGWIFTTVALLPMTLYEAASVSADSTTLALSFLVAALLLRRVPLFVDSTRRYGGTLATFLLLALSKTGYTILGLFGFLYFRKMTPKQRWLVILFLTLGLGTAALWVQYAASVYVPLSPEVNAAGQVAHATTADPLGFTDKVFYIINRAFLKGQNGFYQIIGILGWLDTPLPGWVYMQYLAVFPLAMFAWDGDEELPTLNPWQRLGILLTLVLGTLLIFFWLYVSYNPVGNFKIEGLQGRYFIPFLAPFLIAVSCPLKKFTYKTHTLAALLLVVWVMTVLTLLPQCTPLPDRATCPQYPVSFFGDH